MDCLIFENSGLNDNHESPEADGRARQQEAIDFSNLLIGLFEDVCEDVEEVSIEDLKKVYVKAAHNCETDKCSNINLWALARIILFIRMKSQKEIKQTSESSLKQPISKITEIQLESPFFYEDLQSIDITAKWEPSPEDFSLAEQFINKYDLKFTFSSVDDLYIEEYKPLELELE